MHDPLTVAFDIRRPWPKYNNTLKRWDWPSVATIWHKDPERGGSDDSCDWFGRHRKLNKREEAVAQAVWNMEPILDNRPFYPDHPAHKEFQELRKAVHLWKRRSRLRIHPRWHVWHWEVQVHFIGDLKRWLFSKCCRCGKGFPWGYAVVTSSWDSTGPRWFRGEKNVYHHDCDDHGKQGQAASANE